MSFSKIRDESGLSSRDITTLHRIIDERDAQEEATAKREAFLNEKLHPTLSELIKELGGRPKGPFCWLRFQRHTFVGYYSGTRGYGHGYRLCKQCGHDIKSMYFGNARPLIPG